jgi:hypothetical protein
VLFVGAGVEIAEAVRAVGGGVLTVSEIDTDERVDSVINFVVRNQHVAFDVNVDAATRAQLTVGARLLGVARAVDGRRRRKD